MPHLRPVLSITFIQNGKTVVSASGDRVRLWDTGQDHPETRLEIPASWRSAVAYSPDGKTLAYSAARGVVKLCNPVTGLQQARLDVPDGAFLGIGFSRDSTRLAVGWTNLAPKVWDLTTMHELGTIRTAMTDYQSMMLAPDGQTLALGGAAHTTDLTLWNTDTGQMRTVLAHAGRVCKAVHTPDGKSLVTADQDGTIQFWNGRTFAKEFGFKLPVMDDNWVYALAFSPNGKQLVVSGKSGWLWSFDAETGRLLATFRGHSDAVVCLAVFPDGRTLVSGSFDGTIKLWDLSTGQERFSLVGHQGKLVASLTVAPNGKTIATGGFDGSVRLWRAADDKEASARKTELDPDDPDSVVALMNLGDVLWKNGQIDAATAAYDKADERLSKLAAAFPEQPDYQDRRARAHHNRALQLGQTGRLEEAQKHFRQAIALWVKLGAPYQTDLGRCQSDMGHLLVANGRFDEAEKAYRNFIQIAPQNPSGHNNLAWLLATCPELQFRDPKQAVELAKRAVELAPTVGQYWNTLGVAHYRAGDEKSAIEALEKAMSLRKGGDSFDWFFLAMIY
jgi:WD40 repeat protein